MDEQCYFFSLSVLDRIDLVGLHDGITGGRRLVIFHTLTIFTCLFRLLQMGCRKRAAGYIRCLTTIS